MIWLILLIPWTILELKFATLHMKLRPSRSLAKKGACCWIVKINGFVTLSWFWVFLNFSKSSLQWMYVAWGLGFITNNLEVQLWLLKKKVNYSYDFLDPIGRPKRKEGSFLWGIIHSLHYLGMMNEEEVEQLSNGETLTEQQETLRCQKMNLGNLISRYLLPVYMNIIWTCCCFKIVSISPISCLHRAVNFEITLYLSSHFSFSSAE